MVYCLGEKAKKNSGVMRRVSQDSMSAGRPYARSLKVRWEEAWSLPLDISQLKMDWPTFGLVN